MPVHADGRVGWSKAEQAWFGAQLSQALLGL